MGATLKQVAEEAGVSTTTVSFVLNKRRQARTISPQTRDLVKKVAIELQYSPNQSAKSLRTQKTMTIGILTGNWMDSHLGKLIEGVNAQCTKEGYRSILASVGEKDNPEEIAQNLLNPSVADAIVIVDRGMDFSRDAIENIADCNRPVVLVGKYLKNPPCPCVCDDYFAYGFEGTNYFFKKGIKEIGYAGFDNDSSSELLKGAQKAYKELKIDWNLAQFIKIPYDEYRKIRINVREKLLPLWQKKSSVPEALYFLNDQILYAALKILSDLKVKIPRDTSIIGYGDMDMMYNILSPAFSAALTQPGHSGSKAVEIAVKSLKGKSSVSKNKIITLGGSFRFRQST